MVFFNAYILKLLLFLTIYVQDVKPKKEASNSNGFFISIQGKNNSTLELEFKKAVAFYENRKYVEGLRLALILYEKIKEEDNTNIRYGLTNLIAKIYRNNKEHKKAILYFKKSLRLLNKNFNYNKELNIENDKYLAEIIFVLGSEYQQLKINDSAIFYYEKLAKLNSLDDEILARIGSSYTNLSAIYQNDTLLSNHHIIAIEFAEKAIAIHKKRNNKLRQASAISNLGSVYLRQRDFERSKKTYLNGIKLIKRDTTTRAIEIKAKLYYNLAWVMRNLKEYEAYDYQEISYDMEDELRDDEMTQNIKRITGEYNVDVVRKEGEFEKQKAENLTWIISISSVAIILLLAFFLNQYKLRQQNLSLQLINKETASQLEVLNATLAGEETARKQISQELHDGILGKLFGSRMGLGYLELQASTETQLKYESFLNELQHIEQEIRDVSHKLHYNFSSIEVYFIKNIDLQLQEKSLLGNFSYKLQIDKKLSWENIASDIKLELYRILQECFQNILKHAKPSKVLLDFKLANKQLLIELVDDGIGFNTNQQFKGIGLKNIQVRAEKIGGSIQVLSEKTKGTTVQIKIPMSEHV